MVKHLARDLCLDDAAALAGGALVYWATPGDFASGADVERLRACLDREESARMDRFRFDVDKHIYLVAHALVRGALSRLLGGNPADFRFDIMERGRPELAAPSSQSGMRFNLSHTKGRVACAFAMGREVGVDVERVDRRVDIMGLARSVLSPSEISDLESQSEAGVRARFFELWTLKEAYIKAVGQGLGLPLREISFSFPGPPPVSFATVCLSDLIEDDGSRLQYHCQELAPKHQLAVGVEGCGPVHVHGVARDELMQWLLDRAS